MNPLESLRRRLGKSADPEQAVRVADQLTATLRERGTNPILASLAASKEPLLPHWQQQFNRELASALRPIERAAQLGALHRLAVSYLTRCNDGWRSLADPRLLPHEVDGASKVRDAFSGAAAMRDAVRQLRGESPTPSDFLQSSAPTYAQDVAVHQKLFRLDGALAQLSLGHLEGLTKGLLGEDLLNDNATIAMDASDLRFVAYYKALAHSQQAKATGRPVATTFLTEMFCAEALKCFAESTTAISIGPLRDQGVSKLGPFSLELNDWNWLFDDIHRSGPLSAILDQVASLLWTHIAPLLSRDDGAWSTGQSHRAVENAVLGDLCSVFFVARCVNCPTSMSADTHTLINALADLAYSAQGLSDMSAQRQSPMTANASHTSGASFLWMWCVALQAELPSQAAYVVRLASNLSIIADMEYLAPVQRVELFLLVKFMISIDLVKVRDGSRSEGHLHWNWIDSFDEYRTHERRLLAALATHMKARLTERA